ncbi:MAG: hypothetical protein PHC70_03055 [Patescibacteria group bacterium]|nr:hypothetical protein [Patescibacteria group bacterium]
MQEESKGLRLVLKTHWERLTKKQKAFFVVFVLCATGALVFSYLSVRDGIYAPFKVSLEEIQKNKDLLKDPEVEAEKLAKRVDSDGDGLSDWDEEHVYHTSPYLRSTAGDSMPDNVKIALGENPLCKHGEDCEVTGAMTFNLPSSTYPGADMVGSNVQEDLGSILMGNTQAGQNFQNTASQAGVDLSLDNLIPRDPAMLRQALLQTGKVKQADLDKLTDEQLLKYFDEAKAEVEKNNANLAGQASSTQKSQP